jgi:hypothetical protein
MDIIIPKLGIIQIDRRKIFALSCASVSLALLAIIYANLPIEHSWDWSNYFRPATLRLLSGQSPYHLKNFYNPPWTLIPLIPFALLPDKLSAGVFFIASLIAYVYVAKKLGANNLAVVATLASIPALFSALSGNITGLVALGLVLPPEWGLLLVLTKPQIGLTVALFWTVEAYREGGLGKVTKTLAPAALATAISLVVFGFWLGGAGALAGKTWNTSMYPFSIPVGLALLYNAIQNRDFNLAVVASPFFAPYIAGHDWTLAILAISYNGGLSIAASLGTWLVVALGLILHS